MSTRLVSIFAITSLAIATSVLAETLVTWGPPAKTTGAPIGYLKSNSYDDGYVFVTVRVSPADIANPCVTPTQVNHSDNFFNEGNLEIILSAVPEGFQRVDAKEVPVATFQWTDKNGKYCATPFTLPVLVVPTTRFGNDGTTNWSDPKLNFIISATSAEQNKVIHLAQALIGVGSSLATGGAAATLVGLSKIVSGGAVKTISDEYDKRQSFSSKQVIPMSFSWQDLSNGLRKVQVPIIAGETNSWKESIEDALKRLHTKPVAGNSKPLFMIEATFEYRRSVFVGDGSLVGGGAYLPPGDSQLSKERVLNHPQNSLGIPSILQKVNGYSPTLGTLIKDDNPTQCGVAINGLRDLGLTSLDRAIAMAAFLDEISPLDVTGKPVWRSRTVFQQSCFALDAEVVPTLRKVFGTDKYSPLTAVKNLDVTTDVPTWWNSTLANRMVNLQAIFYQPPTARPTKLVQMAGGSPISWNLDFVPVVAGEEPKLIQELDVSSMGCIFGVEADAGLRVGDTPVQRAYAVALAKGPGMEKPARYLLTADFRTNSPNTLIAFQMQSMENPAYAGYLSAVRTLSFDAASECKRKILQ